MKNNKEKQIPVKVYKTNKIELPKNSDKKINSQMAELEKQAKISEEVDIEDKTLRPRSYNYKDYKENPKELAEKLRKKMQQQPEYKRKHTILTISVIVTTSVILIFWIFFLKQTNFFTIDTKNVDKGLSDIKMNIQKSKNDFSEFVKTLKQEMNKIKSAEEQDKNNVSRNKNIIPEKKEQNYNNNKENKIKIENILPDKGVIVEQ